MSALKISLPPAASRVIARLEAADFAAYAVGGCVRDSLSGRVPHDWDVCTAAGPQQVTELFAGEYRVLPTGLPHGTVTVLVEGEGVEVTTFRTEGGYADGRHPDSVRFVPEVEADLARRDFTINAMAYSPGRGLVDPFGGQADLAAGVLRCVGDPAARYAEDALRILRAVRFCAQCGLTPDPATAAAANAMADRLALVSKERITEELCRLLAAPRPGRVLAQFRPVLLAVLPKLAEAVDFDQRTPWHEYDVLSHILHAVDAVDTAGLEGEGLVCVRLAALLHDWSKPECYILGDDGRGHFPGHPERGAQRAEELLPVALRLPGRVQSRVVTLVRWHEAHLEPDEQTVRRWMAALDEETLFQLIRVRRADLAAHGQNNPMAERLAEITRRAEAFEALWRQLAAQNPCVRLSQLALKGDDLLALGLPAGPQVGQLLHALLEEVLADRLPNEYAALREAAAAQIAAADV